MELKNFYEARKELQNQVSEVVKAAHDLKAPDIEDAQYMGILEMNLRLMAAKVSDIRKEYVSLLQEQFCEDTEDDEGKEQPQVEPEAPAPAPQQPDNMVSAILSGIGAFASAWTFYQQQSKR